MNKIEKIILWGVLGIIFAAVVVSTALVTGELKEINQNLRALRGGEALEGGFTATPRPLPTTVPGSHPGGGAQVAVAGVQVLTDTVSMTVTVRSHGAGDLLFEPPVLRTTEGDVYPVSGDCMEDARLAFLDLVTKGSATARFEFVGRLRPTTQAWLVFNPGRESFDTIAPRVEAPISLSTGGE